MKTNVRHAVIVGAGVAGATTAASLREHGVAVTVLEAGEHPAAGASGNYQGAVYIKPAVQWNAETALASAALDYTQEAYLRWQHEYGGDFWHPTGLLQVALSETDAHRQNRIIASGDHPASRIQGVTAREASHIAGIPIPRPALWYPGSGWVRPDKLCSALLTAPGIHLRTRTKVVALVRSETSDEWQLTLESGETLTGDAVVICAANASHELLPCPLPLKPIRGQVSLLPCGQETPPKVVVCGDGYVNPPCDGWQVIGASFDLDDPDPLERLSSHQDNQKRLGRWLPELANDWPDITRWRGRTRFRATTPDYQPIAGPLWQDQALVARLRRKSRIRGISTEKTLDMPGLYTLTGLGSKGLTYAPLLARYITGHMLGQPPVLAPDLTDRIWPGRFRARGLRRQE